MGLFESLHCSFTFFIEIKKFFLEKKNENLWAYLRLVRLSQIFFFSIVPTVRARRRMKILTLKLSGKRKGGRRIMLGRGKFMKMEKKRSWWLTWISFERNAMEEGISLQTLKENGLGWVWYGMVWYLKAIFTTYDVKFNSRWLTRKLIKESCIKCYHWGHWNDRIYCKKISEWLHLFPTPLACLGERIACRSIAN